VFHADPHRRQRPPDAGGRLALLDFGLIGRLDDDTRTALALLLLAIAQTRADASPTDHLALATSVESDEAGFVHDLRRQAARYHLAPAGRDPEPGKASPI